MRHIGIICGISLIAGLAYAADEIPAHAIRVAGPYEPSMEFHIPADKAETLLLAEWEATNARGTMSQISWGEESVAKAPASASKYVQKSYSFPTGMIRVLDFKQASGGMYHAISSETGLYMLKGTGSVEVAGKTVVLNEGDVVSYPRGVLRGSGDATVVLWTVRGTLINEAAAATVVHAADAPTTSSAEWDVDGKRFRTSKPEELAKAPESAIRLDLKRYEFPGNSVRVTRNYKGGPT
ncbi:MAG: hypothetical protein KDE14_15400, partial [Rhodobacteraceae bacterium]|nr:hypothetical protein [Paracoccaceae bacterium]